MITKRKRDEVLERIHDKDNKLLISKMLDKAIRFEKNNKMTYTNFLNIYELSKCIKILNKLEAKYEVYAINDDFDKKNLLFRPAENNEFKNVIDFVECIKIKPNKEAKLTHKDYMGAMYKFGIKEDCIGDIFAYDDVAYVFLMKEIAPFVLKDLHKVGSSKVELEKMDINSDEVKNLSPKLVDKNIIISSFRVDMILTKVYNGSRTVIQQKIERNNLFVNSKQITSTNHILNEGDVVSFKKYGKIKIGKVLSKTKTGSNILNVKIYS